MTASTGIGRRRALRALGAGGLFASMMAGCTGDPSFPNADVIAGPGGRLVFDPETLRAPVGSAVTWGFASPGHNVSCRPEDAERVELPAGAEPFASYGPDASPSSIVPRGSTFEHRFETAGTYRYVCIPHIQSGMVATITIE